MAHGYLRELDEDWDRGDDRDRQDRERDFGDRGLMFADRERRPSNDWERAPRKFRSHQHDHYLSWRDKQMEALDRDYAEYCQEREQRFHQDFDSWRRNRLTHGSEEEILVAAAERLPPVRDPAEPATLGAAEPEIQPPGRVRRPPA
jgi:hypothetical protein